CQSVTSSPRNIEPSTKVRWLSRPSRFVPDGTAAVRTRGSGAPSTFAATEARRWSRNPRRTSASLLPVPGGGVSRRRRTVSGMAVSPFGGGGAALLAVSGGAGEGQQGVGDRGGAPPGPGRDPAG